MQGREFYVSARILYFAGGKLADIGQHEYFIEKYFINGTGKVSDM